MKHLAIATLMLAALSSMTVQARETVCLNEGWSYRSYQAKNWGGFTPVSLPHTWNAEYLPGTHSYNREMMIYRRNLEITPDMDGKQLLLYFEGAQSACDVFVNKRHAGEHLGGYTAFCIDITDKVKPGANEIEVWVSNAARTDILPISGDFNIYGGLHRPCHLIITEKDFIFPYFGGPGVAVYQDNISRENAEFRVRTWVNMEGVGKLTIRASIFDADGKMVAENSDTLDGNSRYIVIGAKRPTNLLERDIRFNIPKPHLWNGKKDPYMYMVRTELIRDGKVIDCVEQNTGFRFCSIDPDHGFFLNGEKYPLNGICKHDAFQGHGSAMTPECYERDIELLNELGATALRLAHYPHGNPIYDLSDRNGIVLWSEIPLCGPGGYTYAGNIGSEGFKNNAIQSLQEMVYQKINHPSVCFWSLFNELIAEGDRTYDDPGKLVGGLNAICKHIDPTRLTCFANASDMNVFKGKGDGFAMNMYPGWYFPSEPVSLGQEIDKTHRQFPSECLAISEYGAGACVDHHQWADPNNPDPDFGTLVNPSGRWHPEEVQSTVIEDCWQAFGTKEYLWGTFLWILHDFQSDIREEGAEDGINDKGIVTYDRKIKKDAFYFLKAQWNSEPMVYVTSRRWVERDYAKTYVKAYTNAPEATLFINGRKIGSAKADSLHRVIWNDIVLADGWNNIEVRAKFGRKTLSDSCDWHLIPDFPEVGDAYGITSGPHDHLLANYFGINAWSPDNRYVCVLETDLNGRLPEAGEYATIGLVDLQDGNRFIPVAKTCCWNFQEAAMVHWIPWAKDTFVYNDLRDGRFVAVMLNWKSGKEKILPFPVSAVSADGNWGVSINYSRLRLTRPDYGYAGNGQDALASDQWPSGDGLHLVNMHTGETRLIVDIASCKNMMTPISSADGLAYFCHTVISKNAKRIFWLARTAERDSDGNVYGWGTTSFTCNLDGSEVRRCFPDGWGGSHFNWKDDGTMVVTCNYDNRVYGHVLFEVGRENEVRHIGEGEIDFDGHCIFSPDGEFVSTDGYFNEWDGYNREWKIIRLCDGAVQHLGYFYVPENYRNDYIRCDLHPRFRPDGRQIAFNSVHEGSRQVYLRDIR